MSFFTWGPAKTNDDDESKSWSAPKRIRISDISYSHSPDKRGERTDKYGRQPIEVTRRGGRYVVADGHDRVYYAKQRGDSHITARVWD